MSNSKMVVRLLAPLAVALFVIAVTLGLSQPVLVETVEGSVVCASAFGNADFGGGTDAAQASCAALTSERQMWSFTLLGTGLGLLLGLFWVALTTSTRDPHELAAAQAPAAEWVDYPAAGPIDPADSAPTAGPTEAGPTEAGPTDAGPPR